MTYPNQLNFECSRHLPPTLAHSHRPRLLSLLHSALALVTKQSNSLFPSLTRGVVVVVVVIVVVPMLVSSSTSRASPATVAAAIASTVVVVQLFTSADPVGRCVLFLKQLRGHVRQRKEIVFFKRARMTRSYLIYLLLLF